LIPICLRLIATTADYHVLRFDVDAASGIRAIEDARANAADARAFAEKPFDAVARQQPRAGRLRARQQPRRHALLGTGRTALRAGVGVGAARRGARRLAPL